MFSHVKKLIFILLISGFFQLYGQGFGQNKVQYRDFDWHYLQTEHFDIYFYSGGYSVAEFTAYTAEKAYKVLKRDFNYELTKRVSIIVYKSHNDFQQTNVISTYLPEGVGGVTELYKNRVVVPFEGSYSQFRHVIHHELVHAVMNDMLYGGSVQSIISGEIVQVPTWFAEGLAEYFSQRWNTRTDMMVRDATINNYLVQALPSFGAYFGGNAFFRYIAEEYGNEKVAEILHKIKGSIRFQNVFKSALGLKIDELMEKWQKKMRKEYWPDIKDRLETEEFAHRLTNHRETNSYLNISPALSPKGDKVAFLSNMDGKQSIYIMDMFDNSNIKRIIKGETDVDFEELHWLSPGMGWSPDATKLTFSAKAGDEDALYIYDTKTEEVTQKKFGLDGIFSAVWSPQGDEIAFVGNLNGNGDIYVYSIEKDKIEKITDDQFSDTYPHWSNDGTKIAFVSERGKYLKKEDVPADFKMSDHDFKNTDIYIVDRRTKEISAITQTPFLESDPIFGPDDKKVLYTSDQNGISNIYVYDIESGESYPISNLLSGAFQLSMDQEGHTLVFTSFSELGFDLYSIKNPLKLPRAELEETEYRKKLEDKNSLLSTVDQLTADSSAAGGAEEDSSKIKVNIPQSTDYTHYVFADLNRRTKKVKKAVALKEEEYKREDGDFRVHNYKVKFSADLVNGEAEYNTYWGFQGFTQIAYSDVLGNHQIYLGTNLVFDLRNSYIVAQYLYLPKRTDYGVSFFNYSNTYFSYRNGLTRFRNYGASFLARRPFNKFSRIDASIYFMTAELEYLSINVPTQRISSFLPSIRYVYDTSEWWFTGPRDGFRGSVSITTSPKYSDASLEFTTVKTDLRKYFKLHDYYHLAFRLAAGASIGRDAQNFYFGGVDNWLNREFNGGLDRYINSVKDVYFSEFVTPVRGARFYEKVGHQYGLINAELRFPLILRLDLGLPPISIGYIQGVLFTDVGSAWDNPFKFRGVKNGRVEDLFIGYGTGARVYLFGFLLKYDLAWQYDLEKSSLPKHYFSIGIDF
ncbi:MAG TPA: biopolymer transporter Tol [Caldithrix abyssi]|uniref:Biopolymer transporter Tol n=1 Tax=Caldithrix abyssi TaxID=187145 RepID=A0A7V1LN49_CALAY|nr:biopolymer transporter Tol [Caldithrix abyssi]